MSARLAPTPIAQTGTSQGLLLAALIGASWLSIHVGGIFFWTWRPALIPAAIVLVLVQTWLSTGLFIVAHDCMHGSLVPGKPALNRAVGTLALAVYAALSYPAILPKHHQHHAAPGTALDPDFDAASPDRPLPWFIRFMGRYYSHGQIARIALAAACYMLLGASLLNIVVFWAVPALLALAQLFLFGTFLPHRHAATPFVDHHHARSNNASNFLSLVTCFHFGGFHHEHHLSPGTPWWKLPAHRRASR